MTHDRLATPKIESTVRYLGIEIDDAIEIAENQECVLCGARSSALQQWASGPNLVLCVANVVGGRRSR